MKVTVKVPASTANIGSGVDCLGIGLSKYLTVVMEDSEQFEVIFKEGFSGEIPLQDNLVYEGAKRIFDKQGTEFPTVKITMFTDIPGSRGLGSSASAIVAGVLSLKNPTQQRCADRLLRHLNPTYKLIIHPEKLIIPFTDLQSAHTWLGISNNYYFWYLRIVVLRSLKCIVCFSFIIFCVAVVALEAGATLREDLNNQWHHVAAASANDCTLP